MTSDELRMLLYRINSLDHRKLNDAVAKAWWPLMANIPYDDAVEAVNMHFRDSTAYLQPGHIVANAKRLAALRRAEETAGDWRSSDTDAVPCPPKFHEAIAAAREVTARAVAAGHSRGSDIVKQAAWAAARRVLDENDE